ncbi:extracellular solute-binding protein [Rhodovulum sp. BSW8]|uniref:ABC transporter substrate-binding protein n=1 Tax=Rhodovulum visakhapatnamense TaxID=364297 RepID=A0A4R8GCD3_9RHOB|nr:MULTISPECIES: ABC transporter substrate-binding protein [Rhodovulum]OLS43333.1 ABC transporter substrate-binding protein [Rhodovulum sulfidophilum]MBL3569517.1 ABC transporter substrate-binding protein [Rhodovulum visakhapatnamense]MBL3577667.1 ABC transporter substrate-binding protein [Rhodovulum visakhapatnamense]RBO52284.1 extracellular solute-binding protein [Rhodovulum sp. BSW8]TDX33390.1 iron(III) transport system substrate-binding protein [Rhodovulum visakhapatnamense]
MRLLALATAGLMATAASAETTITLYTSQAPEQAQETVDAFEAAHPDIKVEWTRNGTSALMNVLRAEIEAGQVQPDVLLVADVINLGELKAGGHLLPYTDAPVAAYDPAMYDPDMTFFGTKAITTGIAWNTEIAEPVETWADLLKEENRGQIAVPSPLYSGAALCHLHTLIDAPGIGWAFYEGLNDLDIVPEGGNGPATKAVASGMAKYAILVDANALRAKADGSPIDYIAPKDGVSVITEPVAILSTTDQPEAAKTFVDFLLSRKGQELVAKQGNLPILPGVAGPEGFPDLASMTLLPLNADAAVRTDAAVRAKFAEIFGL